MWRWITGQGTSASDSSPPKSRVFPRILITSADSFLGHHHALHLLTHPALINDSMPIDMQGHGGGDDDDSPPKHPHPSPPQHRLDVTAACVVPDKSMTLRDLGANMVAYRLEDLSPLEHALRHRDLCILVIPAYANFPDSTQAMIKCIERAGVQNLILQVAMGADRSDPGDGDGKYKPGKWMRAMSKVEKMVRDSRIKHWCIVRHAMLHEDLMMWSHDTQKTGGKIALPIGNATMPLVAAKDVSEFITNIAFFCPDEDKQVTLNGGEAAEELDVYRLPRPYRGKTFDLTGPRTYTGSELAELATAAIEHPFTFQDVDRGSVGHYLEGLPNLDVSEREWLLEWFDMVKAGCASKVDHKEFKRVVGRNAIGVQWVFREHAPEFRPREK